MGSHVKRRVYLLPNLMTAGNLFAGFYAIVASVNSEFEKAAIALYPQVTLFAFAVSYTLSGPAELFLSLVRRRGSVPSVAERGSEEGN